MVAQTVKNRGALCLIPITEGWGEEGIQTQFRITGQETVLETASVDVAFGKDEEIVLRLREKILLASLKNQPALQ